MIAPYYYNQRFAIRDDLDRLQALRAAVGHPTDLAPAQWAQWFSVARSFQPDLILELGRGHGNSTALFAQVASQLGRTRVVSLCESPDWITTVAPRLEAAVPGVDAAWLARVDARMTDIRAVDYEDIFAGRERVLVIWDAHGFAVAEVVLGIILPAIAKRPHLVLMHDILDNRYANVSLSYDGQPLWKGSAWQQRTGSWDSRVNIGWMHAIQDQVIALADFASRNGLAIGSGDHELHEYFNAYPEREHEMRALLGGEFFSRSADWAFLSLDGAPLEVTYPAVEGFHGLSHRAALDLRSTTLAEPIVTEPQPWQYAALSAWNAPADVPADARVWLNVTLRVEGGSVGLGLLDASGGFAARRAVGPTARAIDVRLPIDDRSRGGTLVVQTWAAPVSARVAVKELSLVW